MAKRQKWETNKQRTGFWRAAFEVLFVLAFVVLFWTVKAKAQGGTPITFSGMTAVGSGSQPVTVTLTAQVSGTINAISVLTSGLPNLDFSLAPANPLPSNACVMHASLTAGQTCTVSVEFSPRYPGVRQGAVVLQTTNISTNTPEVLASSLLSGIGQGGLPVLVPAEINTVAGDGELVFHGDNVPATLAPIYLPSGLAVDAAGNLFLCDSSNNRIRRVDAGSGVITTYAGNGTPGAQGDGGQATSAQLDGPSGVVLDGAGNLYIADTNNNVIRRVDAVTGVITTFAGKMGGSGYAGDGGAATNATLTSPEGIALTPTGDLVIADTGDNAVRLVTMSAVPTISTLAGTGVASYNGDGIPATHAYLNAPFGVAVRSDGAVAIADMTNQRIRLVINGQISTVAGDGQRSFTGDGGLATQSELDNPVAIAFDPAGDLFIADSGNNRVRAIFGSPGVISTLTGNSSEEFSGDGGPDNQASLYNPYALVLDPSGNLWVSDRLHNRVREITGSKLGITYPTMKVGKVSAPVTGSLYNGGNTTLTLHAPVLNQAHLDPATTTCNQSPMATMAFCNMGIEFAPTQVSHNDTGSVTWPSDAPNVTPVAYLNGNVLSVEPTTVAITADMNPGLLGKPVTLTATVTSANSNLSGNVSFSEGSTPYCQNVSLAANGTATCTVQSLSLGSHELTATYSGDNDDAASTSQPYTEVIKQQPALALGVSGNPAVVTNPIKLTLTAQDQNGTPTGTIVFYDGTTVLGSVTLSSGVATWTVQNLSVGTHNLSAQYSGDTANAAGTSNVIDEQITQASTLTVLASSSSTVTVGTAVTLNATVVSNDGPAPTGSVQFTDGSGAGAPLLGSAPLDANGKASITISTLTPGTHNLVASYGGDTDSAVSHSAPLPETVQPIATLTNLSGDVNPLNAGATLHLTAIVAMAPGATADGSLSGTVSFHDGSTLLGSAPINASGQATLAVSTLAVGSHTLTAAFAGSTNYASSTSNNVNETVQQTATQVGLSSAASTTLVGKSASFTATVTSVTGVPTGSITFRDGTTVLGSVNLGTNGVASFSTTTLSQGTHTITAVYSGDANYQASTSVGVQQTVQLAQPTLTLSGPSGPVDAGTSAQFTASLTTPGIAPTGTVSFFDGNNALSSLPVSGNGSLPFTTSSLSIGTHTITARYSGDGDNATTVSGAITVIVRQANSATALLSSSNPLTLGATLTLSATITSDSPNAGGSVSFYDGTTLLGTASLGPNQTASFSPTGLALGAHGLTAVYTGDTNHAGSTSTPLAELVVQSSAATLVSSNNPAASGQNVIFTTQVTGTGAGIATGTATFRDGGVLLAAVPLNGAGQATFATTTLAVGTHAISVTYGGDKNFAVTSASLTQTVVDASTQVSLTAGANPATYGQPLSLTATVTSNGGTATGMVNFTEGGTTVGSAQLNGSAVAVMTISTLSPGAHTLVASYAGDGKANPSVSAPLAVTVKQTTALTVTSNGNPALTLSAISLTATLTDAGAAVATGPVTFADGGTVIGTAPLDGSGHATLTLPQMTAGTHKITASYAGDGADFASTSAAYSQVVQLRPTTTTVTESSTDPTNPQQITLIAVVKGQGSTPPTGSLTFTSGSLSLGVATIDDTGVATITIVMETSSEPVVASYAGDASYIASQSSSTTITAGQAAQFTLTVNVPSITLVSHQHTTVNVTLGSVKGFTDTIALGCLGLPYAATCTFNNGQLKLAPDGSVTTTLIIDTGDPLGAGTGTSASVHPGKGSTLLCWLPLGLLLGLARGKTRRAGRKLGALLVLAVAIALTLGTTGCSGLQTSGTAPGTYSFKVVGTGQGSGTTQAQSVTLVVTQ